MQKIYWYIIYISLVDGNKLLLSVSSHILIPHSDDKFQ